MPCAFNPIPSNRKMRRQKETGGERRREEARREEGAAERRRMVLGDVRYCHTATVLSPRVCDRVT
eukprot:3448799-Rhodomonas_salina.2